MRRENLAFWISILSIAGIGWGLDLAVWFCEADPGGLARATIREDIGLRAAAAILRHGSHACFFGDIILIAIRFIEEAIANRHPVRRLCARP